MCQIQAASQQKTTNYCFSLLLAALYLFACLSGCWQEIRYEPGKEAQVQRESVAKTEPAETPPAELPEPDVEESATNADAEQPIAEEILPTPAGQTSPSVPESVLPKNSPNDAAVPEEPEAGERAPEAGLEVAEGDDDLAWLEAIAPTDLQQSAVPSDAAVKPLSAADRQLAAWRMSSDWSMAAALLAKGQDQERYAKLLEQATKQSALLGIELPALPGLDAGRDAEAQVLEYLLNDAGPRLASRLNEQHGKNCAALAELAAKSHVLLLSYSPQSSRLEPVIDAIQRAAEGSGLPTEVWQPLIDALAQRADYQIVKAAVFDLHRRAAGFLARAVGPDFQAN